jgi:superfamily II DNA/RNA helicase
VLLQLFGNETRPLLSLILCPTRELAMQVKDHLVSAARFTGTCVCLQGNAIHMFAGELATLFGGFLCV